MKREVSPVGFKDHEIPNLDYRRILHVHVIDLFRPKCQCCFRECPRYSTVRLVVSVHNGRIFVYGLAGQFSPCRHPHLCSSVRGELRKLKGWPSSANNLDVAKQYFCRNLGRSRKSNELLLQSDSVHVERENALAPLIIATPGFGIEGHE